MLRNDEEARGGCRMFWAVAVWTVTAAMSGLKTDGMSVPQQNGTIRQHLHVHACLSFHFASCGCRCFDGHMKRPRFAVFAYIFTAENPRSGAWSLVFSTLMRLALSAFGPGLLGFEQMNSTPSSDMTKWGVDVFGSSQFCAHEDAMHTS